MGNPKHKWTAEEEKALRGGIVRYGTGNWKLILKDPEFNRFLQSRNNIDLKDKWRNISAAEGSRENSRAPARTTRRNQQQCTEPPLEETTCTPLPVAVDEPSNLQVPGKKNAPRYDDMIFEALLTTHDPNGLEFNSLATFIEQRSEVPQTFRKQLSSRLRRLVAQERLEKIGSRYKKKEAAAKYETKYQPDLEPIPEEIGDDENLEDEAQCVADIELMLEQVAVEDSFEEAAQDAAKCVAESEYLSCQQAQAVEEFEWIHNMAQEAAQLLHLANEFVEQCSLGDVVQLA